MLKMKKGITGVLSFLLIFSVIFTGMPSANAYAYARKAETVDNTPGFTITRTMDKASYVEGDTATITYTVKPTGYITAAVRTPADITLMLDVSGSMNDSVWVDGDKWVDGKKGKPGYCIHGYWSTKLVEMKAAAKAFVDNIAKENATEKDLTKKDRISLIFFETDVRATADFTSDYANVKTSIDSYTANGGTNYDEALRVAKTQFDSNSNRSKIAVFFSDGKPTHYSSKISYTWTGKYTVQYYWYGGWYKEKVYGTVVSSEHAYPVRESSDDSVNTISKQAAMRSLRDLRASGVTVYTVGLGDGYGTSGIDYALLNDMAAAGGGLAYTSENAAGLNGIFKRIADQINIASITNIKISDILPENAEILDNQAFVDPPINNKFVIQVSDIKFDKVNFTPDPMTFNVKVKFPVSGLFESKGGKIDYTDILGVNKTTDFDTLSVTVKATDPPNAPTFVLDPNTPTNRDVKVTIKYPSDSTMESRLYKVVHFGEDRAKIPFIKYTDTPVIITDECSVDRPVMIYTTCANSFKRQSADGILAVTNIDKTGPGAPTITTDISTLSKDKVAVTITYPSDVTVKEYRLNGAEGWTQYKGSFDVVPMGTMVEARGKDAAGNVSDITIKNISMFSSIDFEFDGGKLQTSVMRRGSLVANLIFRTTGTGIPRFTLTNGNDESKVFLDKLTVKNATIKDSAENTYSVTKDPSTGEITVQGTSAISTNGTELSMRLTLYIQADTPYSAKNGFFQLKLKDTTSVLEVKVVRDPKLY